MWCLLKNAREVTFDIALGSGDMAAHQQLRQFAIAFGDGIENPVVFGEGLMRTVRRGGELDAVHAHQLIELVAQQLGQCAVAAALNDPVMEVEIAFLLGFTEPANFSRAFKRWYNISPGEYRKSILSSKS